ncbi:AAA family ATPase [Pseudoalteromonas phenolica]|uniref:AAA family ATPase n=1 Tax=Pseudoalteromonas phenolica TaxID=161398 RepID=A0A5S3YXB4_9GAMM|nr:ATP-binding protein [Pseudoalteromonas phenolica]TMP81837.1 AAA family ATPase [Pseudoalteromonas phenolica]
MKLKELYIPNHKGFVNFRTSFDESTPITTIIGQNGVGKSNLIETIISLFRTIDLGEQPEFNYQLKYECFGNDVEIAVDIHKKIKTAVKVNGKKSSLTFIRNDTNQCLPNNIFAYYSGTNWRVEELFVKHQTKFYKNLTEGKDDELRRFFYCRDVHSFFVLLAFLVDKDRACIEILKKLGIQSLDSVLFCLKKPYWFNGKPSEIQQKEGDSRFWYSRGVVKNFLRKLWDFSIAPIDNSERKTLDFRGRTENQDRLYLFVPDDESLRSFAENYKDTTEFFKHLESTYIADLIEEVSVTVNLDNGQKLTFNALSEGERQLITVLGLMKFTRNRESLFLLDEPDTHLNPRWKMNYFSQIESILEEHDTDSKIKSLETSQVILTTHDPLMLTSLNAEQIRVLTKNEETGEKNSEPPSVDPKSMGVEAIIQSELYGIRTSLDEELQHKIDLRNRLLSKAKLGKATNKELIKLNEELESLGLTQSHPNPYFSNFAKALNRNPNFRRPHFTPTEYQDIQDLTDELLSEIINEGDQE